MPPPWSRRIPRQTGRPMRIKLDENLPSELLTELRAAGHDAESVFSEGLTGAADGTVMRAAQREGRAVFTLDKGIGNSDRYPPEDYCGIVLFRCPTRERGAVLNFIRRQLKDLLTREVAGDLLVVSSARIRSRRESQGGN